MFKLLAAVLGLGVLGFGCAGTGAESDAPSADDEALNPQDSSVWNGWTVSSFIDNLGEGNVRGRSTFARASGDATRGGGSCLTVEMPNSTCSTDANCTQYVFAQGGYAYCAMAEGGDMARCWVRPNSPVNYCTQNSNRAPGTFTTPTAWATGIGGRWANLTCMTKTAGPNTACGGTDPSLYVRAMSTAYTPPGGEEVN